MYSKAKLAGHPIHPMLVAFPIAFYTSTIATLIVYAATRDAFWYRAGMFTDVAGVVMAIAALIPGAIDLFALPARSRARATGYQHAGANLVATTAFAIGGALLWRGWHATEGMLDVAAPIAICIVGLFAMGVAGVLGWTLVQRHHVGVRPTMFPVTERRVEEIDDLDELPPRTLRATQVGRPAPITWH
jgi:uncharacterized membrane protein